MQTSYSLLFKKSFTLSDNLKKFRFFKKNGKKLGFLYVNQIKAKTSLNATTFFKTLDIVKQHLIICQHKKPKERSKQHKKPRERSKDLPLLSVLILLIHVPTFFHICPFCIYLSPVPLTSQVLQVFF